MLAVLEESPRETQATIADSLGYDRSWLVGLLDELEEAQLIERKRDPADRRRHVVTMQPAGKRKLASSARSRRASRRVPRPLDADEKATLHRLLLQLAAHRTHATCRPANGSQNLRSGVGVEPTEPWVTRPDRL